MKKSSFPVTNIGSVSLLMIFTVLCLVTFATLSLSSTVSEYRYSRKLAEHNQAYYLASNTATATLREIDDILNTAYTEDEERYYANVRKELARLEDVTADFSGDAPTIAYEVPVNATQALRIVLSLNGQADLDKGYYRIVSWKEIASTQWNGDNSLKLITP